MGGHARFTFTTKAPRVGVNFTWKVPGALSFSSADRRSAWAPIGADRFYNLVKHHFYDNASFFRVVPGFVVQFGISAYPPVAAAWEKANIQDEPVTQSNKRGYLTYAKTSLPNTRSTQIFINLKDNAGLDLHGFSPFR